MCGRPTYSRGISCGETKDMTGSPIPSNHHRIVMGSSIFKGDGIGNVKFSCRRYKTFPFRVPRCLVRESDRIKNSTPIESDRTLIGLNSIRTGFRMSKLDPIRFDQNLTLRDWIDSMNGYSLRLFIVL